MQEKIYRVKAGETSDEDLSKLLKDFEAGLITREQTKAAFTRILFFGCIEITNTELRSLIPKEQFTQMLLIKYTAINFYSSKRETCRMVEDWRVGLKSKIIVNKSDLNIPRRILILAANFCD